MTAIDELLANNGAYAARFSKGELPIAPRLGLAIVACMDARIELGAALGLREGDAHVIRNAGGVISDDAIRSLTISQRLLGTREIMLIHHSDCGMVRFSEAELKERIREETGIRPPFAMEAFPDVEGDVRQSLARIQACPFLPCRDLVRGFVYEVESGRLRELG